MILEEVLKDLRKVRRELRDIYYKAEEGNLDLVEFDAALDRLGEVEEELCN